MLSVCSGFGCTLLWFVTLHHQFLQFLLTCPILNGLFCAGKVYLILHFGLYPKKILRCCSVFATLVNLTEDINRKFKMYKQNLNIPDSVQSLT